MKKNIVLLPGDGIGPEVVSAAQQVLEAVAARFGHEFIYQEYLIGGCSIDAYGTALTDETLSASMESDAILLGAVGGPKWDDPTAKVRPEQGLLGLRKGLQTFANLRPVKPHPDLMDASPLRPERLANVDLIVVRELTGGIYFGKPSERRQVNGQTQAVDTMSYMESEIRRVTRLAFELARGRRKKVTSVDKANVLESSRLWRQTVVEVAKDYPDVALEHVLVAVHDVNRAAPPLLANHLPLVEVGHVHFHGRAEGLRAFARHQRAEKRHGEHCAADRAGGAGGDAKKPPPAFV